MMMHIYVIFAHPSKRSFTFEVLEAFTRGLQDAGNTYEIGDLYGMDFMTDMDLDQYTRESSLSVNTPIPEDVKREQDKIDRADALVFVYPIWWSDCPAKLKGWFDRVWAYGYAYYYEDGEHLTSKIKTEKALVLCPAGNTVEQLEETGIAESMRRIMLNDRLLGVGVKEVRMEILGGMVENDETVHEKNLKRAYQLGKEF